MELTVTAAVVFWISAVVAVLAGAAVFYVDSMARATYALALSFVAVGVAVLTLHQGYLGVVVVLMMVMEMAVMAVYMVMFMGMNPALMPMSDGARQAGRARRLDRDVRGPRRRRGARPLARAAVAAAVGPDPRARGGPHGQPHAGDGRDQPGDGGDDRRRRRARRRHRTRYDRLGDDLDQRPARDPQPGGVGR